MFEKEAEEYACEYARQYLHNDGSGLTNSYCETYNGYYRGANDGYNKAKEELENKNAELKELLKEAVQLLKNSDELYSYQIRDFQLKCEQFLKESEE